MTSRSAGLAALLAGLLGATAASHAWLDSLRPPREEAHEVLSRVLGPGGNAAATILGGFRSIAIDVLWVRVFEARDEQRFEDLLPLYLALEFLQGASPSLYVVESDQMAFNVPRLLRHRPAERWTWIRRGLETLERGLRRFPANIRLLRQAEFLYYYRFHPQNSPEDRARFATESRRPGDPVPSGRDPLLRAIEAGEEAVRIPGHPFNVDDLLFGLYLFENDWQIDHGGEARAAGVPGGRDLLARARRLLDHMAEAHRTVEGIVETLDLMRKELAAREPPAGGGGR